MHNLDFEVKQLVLKPKVQTIEIKILEEGCQLTNGIYNFEIGMTNVADLFNNWKELNVTAVKASILTPMEGVSFKWNIVEIKDYSQFLVIKVSIDHDTAIKLSQRIILLDNQKEINTMSWTKHLFAINIE